MARLITLALRALRFVVGKRVDYWKRNSTWQERDSYQDR